MIQFPCSNLLQRSHSSSEPQIEVLNVLCGSPYSQRSGVGKDSTPLANPDSQCTASEHQWGSIAGRHTEAIGQP
jgi:hypothetical protein